MSQGGTRETKIAIAHMYSYDSCNENGKYLQRNIPVKSQDTYVVVFPWLICPQISIQT